MSFRVTVPCTRAQGEAVAQADALFPESEDPPVLVADEPDEKRPDDWLIHAYFEHEPTGVGWPGADAPAPGGMSWSWHELRRGSEWTTAAALFAFVCWGVWALSGGGSLAPAIIVLVVTLIVAVGVFCLARVVGYYVLERAFHRRRRSARGSHLVTALFLAGVGITDLQQTEWVMSAYHWVANNIS